MRFLSRLDAVARGMAAKAIAILSSNNTWTGNQIISGGKTLTISGGTTGDSIVLSNSFPNINAALLSISNGASTTNQYLTVRPSRITFGNTGQSTAAFLSVPANNTWHLGPEDGITAVTAQTLGVQNVVAGTSNTAGTDWTLTGSQGTGTGIGGNIIFKVAPAGTSGTAQNALQTALTISSKGVPVLPAFTVATLPSTPPTGSRAYVTDATAPTYLGALTGGGAVVCPVFYNGSAWISG